MKRDILLLLLFLLILNLASAEHFNFIEENIGNYEYQEMEVPEGIASVDPNYVSYQLKGTDEILDVAVIEYDDKGYLNDYLMRKIPKEAVREVNSQIVYAKESENEILWVNGNKLIEIRSLNPISFPEDIIKSYLELYPSECKMEWCTNIYYAQNYDKYKFGGDGFKEGSELEQRTWDYMGVSVSCFGRNPTAEEIRTTILKTTGDDSRFSDEEIQRIIKECNKGGEEIPVAPREKSPFMQECVNTFTQKLAERGVKDYQQFHVIYECVKEEDFRERYSEEMSDPEKRMFFERLFNERVRSVVNDIELWNSGDARIEKEEVSGKEFSVQKKEEDRTILRRALDFLRELFRR